MVMIFQLEKARDFLLRNGYVFTFRINRVKKEGNDWMNAKRTGKKIADIHVTLCGRHITERELEDYVLDSGFSTLGDWHEEIRRLNNGKLPYYGHIYYVELGHK